MGKSPLRPRRNRLRTPSPDLDTRALEIIGCTFCDDGARVPTHASASAVTRERFVRMRASKSKAGIVGKQKTDPTNWASMPCIY